MYLEGKSGHQRLFYVNWLFLCGRLCTTQLSELLTYQTSNHQNSKTVNYKENFVILGSIYQSFYLQINCLWFWLVERGNCKQIQDLLQLKGLLFRKSLHVVLVIIMKVFMHSIIQVIVQFIMYIFRSASPHLIYCMSVSLELLVSYPVRFLNQFTNVKNVKSFRSYHFV